MDAADIAPEGMAPRWPAAAAPAAVVRPRRRRAPPVRRPTSAGWLVSLALHGALAVVAGVAAVAVREVAQEPMVLAAGVVPLPPVARPDPRVEAPAVEVPQDVVTPVETEIPIEIPMEVVLDESAPTAAPVVGVGGDASLPLLPSRRQQQAREVAAALRQAAAAGGALARRLSALAAPAPGSPAPELLTVPDLSRFYPPAARRAAQAGETLLLLTIDEHGAVIAARVLAAQPPEVFDAAAVRAARELRFAARPGSAPRELEQRLLWRVVR